jgi:endonuclease/exonuclease/phosphatase family metal-dependent hydrolase
MNTLSVMTLNLRFGLADDGQNGWEYRKNAVTSLFREHATDFIATQEANDFQIDYLARNLPEYQYVGRHHPAPRFWQHNILFYRQTLQCEEHVHFFLSETPKVPSRSFGSQFPRQATLGLFHLRGRPILCLNTHFDFDGPAHMGAARVLKQQLASYSKEIPTILMGDFNTTPEAPCYRWLTKNEANGEAGLDFNETFTKPHPSTFHGFTGKPVAGHIDWILFRGALRLKDCHVEKHSIEGVYVSDHNPVVAVFQL